MQSFRSKNGWWTNSMTRSGVSSGDLKQQKRRVEMSKTLETEFKLKRLSALAIPAALERAERYRLLNEPTQAESICLDILEVDPKNQSALILLLLSLTDQFGDSHFPIERALALLPRLSNEYHQMYYQGEIGRAHV